MPIPLVVQLLIPVVAPIAKGIGNAIGKAIERGNERKPRRVDRLLRRYAAAVRVEGVDDVLGHGELDALALRHLHGETTDADRTRLVDALRRVNERRRSREAESW